MFPHNLVRISIFHYGIPNFSPIKMALPRLQHQLPHSVIAPRVLACPTLFRRLLNPNFRHGFLAKKSKSTRTANRLWPLFATAVRATATKCNLPTAISSGSTRTKSRRVRLKVRRKGAIRCPRHFVPQVVELICWQLAPPLSIERKRPMWLEPPELGDGFRRQYRVRSFSPPPRSFSPRGIARILV